ncbi:MAG TPA: methyl-accepting chemotaxis protein, partial [Massilia sp.]|nr:methyl-accepting chemotaxis protein [Massilia sp.]
MRLARLHTGTKLLASFAIVSLLIVVIALVALWRMQAADALTADLVDDKLAKQQLVSDLLGLERLNGSRTVAIARSDSLELADYFQAQLAEGRKLRAAVTARLDKLPASDRERALKAAAAQHDKTLASAQADLFRAKDLGQTNVVEEIIASRWEPAFKAQTAALDALLAHEANEAHRLADASAANTAFSKALLLALGAAALAIGALLAWLLTRNIVGPLQQAVSLTEQVARGDLRPTIEHTRSDEIGRLFDALNGMTGGVSQTVAQVLRGAHAIDCASNEIADGNLDLSQRTERQAASLRRTVGAMDALTGAIADNNASSQRANSLAQTASNVAGEGAQAVEQLVARMEAIKTSAARIVDITGMIDSIAF